MGIIDNPSQNVIEKDFKKSKSEIQVKLTILKLSHADYLDLKYAKQLLNNPSLASKIFNKLGTTIEKGLERLPAWWGTRVQVVSEKALTQTLNLAVLSMGDGSIRTSSERMYKMIAAVSGGVGGAFGLTALAVELPISTVIMFRSIADIARSTGEDIRSIETRLACLEVFAYGGRSQYDDCAESGYFAVRAGLSKTVGAANKFIAGYGAEDGSPILVKLISQISARFGVVVSEKAAAIAIPILGAAGGVLINTIFMEHFQCAARGHFIIRRLEKIYGKEYIEAAYERLDKC
jgi:EcsC protein family